MLNSNINTKIYNDTNDKNEDTNVLINSYVMSYSVNIILYQ